MSSRVVLSKAFIDLNLLRKEPITAVTRIFEDLHFCKFAH